MFYAIAAPATQFALWTSTLIRILETFRFTEPSVPPDRETLSFTRWFDPREHAFSLEVPVGWQIDGGMFRAGAINTRPALELTWPDHQIRCTSGDASIPPFTEPTPMLELGRRRTREAGTRRATARR